MSQPVKLCLIGAGGHATRNVYPSLHRLTDARVLANCDLREDAARALAERFAIPRTYADYNAMVRAERPDGVIVCTGPVGHAAIAIDLLKQGLHVYTEKPTAPSLADALRMLDAQKAAARVCMTAYKKRFAPAYLKTRKIIDSEAFGQKTGLVIYRSSAAGAMPNDKLRAHLLDWTCHTLDLGVYLWGPVHDVSVAASNIDGRYAWSVTMRHSSNAVSHQLFTNCSGIAEEEVQLVGSGGIKVRVDNSIRMLATRNGQPFEIHDPSFTTGSCFSDIEQGFSGELQAFVRAIRENNLHPEANIQHACHALAIFEAMWASAQSGNRHTVEYAL